MPYRKCNKDAIDDSHRTPLHGAARRNHVAAVKILLEHNADMELKDEDGDQPIHVAAENGHQEYVVHKCTMGAIFTVVSRMRAHAYFNLRNAGGAWGDV